MVGGARRALREIACPFRLTVVVVAWAEPREGIVRIINARMATRREVQLFQRRMEDFR